MSFALGDGKQSLHPFNLIFQIFTVLIRSTKIMRVLSEDFTNPWVISRLLEYNDWKSLSTVLKSRFKTKVIINPLFSDKALIKIGLRWFGPVYWISWEMEDIGNSQSAKIYARLWGLDFRQESPFRLLVLKFFWSYWSILWGLVVMHLKLLTWSIV